jgi:hypothetical protein
MTRDAIYQRKRSLKRLVRDRVITVSEAEQILAMYMSNRESGKE